MKQKLIWILLVMMSSLLAACGGSEADLATVEELDLPAVVNVAEVNEIRERDDVVLIDVREQWEYDEAHIPGVNLIPLGELSARMSEIPTDKTVILTCRSGNRSGQAAAFLSDQGFDNVHNMNGGILDWQRSGFPVE